jgi:putative endonuclease
LVLRGCSFRFVITSEARDLLSFAPRKAIVNGDWDFWVYIVFSKSRRIYTGVTNDIGRRVREHKAGVIEGFTQRYRINRLVYYEQFRYVGNAIEKRKRDQKPHSREACGIDRMHESDLGRLV